MGSGSETFVPDRTVRIVVAAVLVVLALYVAQPYLQPLLYSADAPRAVTARGDLAQSETATIALFEQASPSVVHVFAQAAAQNRDLLDLDEGSGEQSGTQTGTGFVWDGAGHVVTNTHVVQNAAQSGGSVSVRMSDGTVVPATLVGMAPSYDLAVLRLGRVTRMPPPLAIHTLTTGVISAVRRRMPTSEGRELSGVIQTDAAINPGNSGGPLLDSAGRLIGVNTAIVSPSGASAGIGFAIPSDVAVRVAGEASPRKCHCDHHDPPDRQGATARRRDAAGADHRRAGAGAE